MLSWSTSEPDYLPLAMTSCWKHGLNVQFIESYVGVVIRKLLNIQCIYVGFDFIIWVVIAAYTASVAMGLKQSDASVHHSPEGAGEVCR
ncbi:unnamed protein product [Camellia sinensis]